MDLSKPNKNHKADSHGGQQKAESKEEFTPGTPVIYAMHGKCQLVGIETRTLNGESIRFYKLELQKPALSRSTRKDPAIWLPVAIAKERGLRSPVAPHETEEVFKILSSREYYFELSLPWSSVQAQLETAIRNEGAIGLAKVASYLYVLKRKHIAPTAEAIRLQETVNKLLLRELSEATGETARTLEEKIVKFFKQKLLLDN